MATESPFDPRSHLRQSRWLLRLARALGALGITSAVAGQGPSDCCVDHPGAGCEDRACESLVCAIDSFCCRVAWDSLCADEAADFPECGCPVAPVGCGVAQHSCFGTGPPGCENAACCKSVCVVDPSCCQTGWDNDCTDLAVDLCPELKQPNLGVTDLRSCVLPDGAIQIAWNNTFLPEWTAPTQLGTVKVLVTIHGAATTLSRQFIISYLPEPNFNAECQGHEPDACGIGQCPPWLATLVSEEPLKLISLSATCLPSPGGCMCGITDFPVLIKMDVPPSERAVAVSVIVDPDNDIDELDETDNALLVLVTSSDVCPTGACCVGGGCIDGITHYDCVVAQRGEYQGDGLACADVPQSCVVQGACALDHTGCLETDEATCIALGGRYQGDGMVCASNCCIAHASIDCDDTSCKDLVCLVDCFCCSVTWDQICANEAIDACAICTPNPVGAPPNNACADAIEVTDGATAFSTLNANAAGPSHTSSCIISADIWFTYHSTTPGPVTVSLCGSGFDTLLAVYDNDQCDLNDTTLIGCNDNFCGSRSQLSFTAGECAKGFLIRVGGWDSASGTGTLTITTAADCPPPDCPADLDGDGVVNGADLGRLLGNWSGAGLGDLNGDGVVDGADLGLMLSAWGICP